MSQVPNFAKVDFADTTVPGGNVPQGGGSVQYTTYNTNCTAAKACDTYCRDNNPTRPGTCYQYKNCFKKCLENGGVTPKSLKQDPVPEATFTCDASCFDPATQVCTAEYGCTCTCDGNDGPASSGSCG